MFLSVFVGYFFWLFTFIIPICWIIRFCWTYVSGAARVFTQQKCCWWNCPLGEKNFWSDCAAGSRGRNGAEGVEGGGKDELPPILPTCLANPNSFQFFANQESFSFPDRIVLTELEPLSATPVGFHVKLGEVPSNACDVDVRLKCQPHVRFYDKTGCLKDRSLDLRMYFHCATNTFQGMIIIHIYACKAQRM